MAVSRRLAFAGRWIWALSIIVVGAAFARAELKVADLLGSAVSGVGPYMQDVTDAIAAFSAGDHETALARLQNAKKVTPALAPAEVMMAQLFFDAGQSAAGNGMLEKALQSAPEDAEAYVALTERAVLEGRLTEADLLLPRAEKAVEVFNQNPRRKQFMQARLYFAGATLDQARGRLDAAKAKLEALIKLDSRNAGSHTKLGQVLFAQNDQKAAYNEFRLAAEADEKSPPAELMMAILAADKVGAERWINFALNKSPGDVRTQLGAANYFLQNNQINRAKKHADEAVKLDPNGFDSNLAAGLVARLDGDFASAEKHLSAAHLQQPANWGVMNHLALVLLELPDARSQDRARQFAEVVVRQNPDNADFIAALGWINYRLNRRVEAERAFTAALKSKQVRTSQMMSSELAYFLANLAKDQGNAAEAIKLLRDCLNTDQPFAYRKMAEQMLAQLAKSSGGTADAPATKAGQPTP
jgi:tetratricopeptide (TPR) repeat protein